MSERVRQCRGRRFTAEVVVLGDGFQVEVHLLVAGDCCRPGPGGGGGAGASALEAGRFLNACEVAEKKENR